MVYIKDLYKTYGTKDNKVEALRGIDLSIEKGEIFGIIGLSGAGKTSLVRCINMLETPDKGRIVVDGADLTGVSKKELRNARKKIGMIFQHFNLLMNATVYDNIAFPLKIIKKDKAFIENRVDELLELVGLRDKKYAYPSMLSGGQKQRIGIARAIAASPAIIMCDEATSALDPATTKSILQLLKLINQKLGMTIIVITHEMEIIKAICDRVAILEAGRVVELGNVTDIYISPKTQTAQKFLNSVDSGLTNELYLKAISDGSHVIKAVFLGEKSTDPYICGMIKQYNVEASILLGNIQHIENMLIGTLIIKIKGRPEEIQGSINYLTENGVLVEVLQNGI